MFIRTLFFTAIFTVVSAVSAFSQTQLVMVEEHGCMWCARWNTEISEIYPKTPEGQAAPLRRMDIRASYPQELTFARPLFFTPTFVLMVDNVEVSRIEGYPGEDFFWGLLKQMLVRENVELTN